MPRIRGCRGVGGGGRRRSLVWALASLLVLPALTTCGIETITIFNAPSFSLPSSNQLALVHNTSNSGASFSGYEIYYRAYETLADADAARGKVESAASLTTATPENCNSLMTNLGFSRIFNGDGTDGLGGQRPLFTISTAEKAALTAVEFDLFLDAASSTSNWYYTRSTDPSTALPVMRSISSATILRNFESSYSGGPSEPDYLSSSGSGAGAGSRIYFVFFAEGYGVNLSSTSFTNSFSLPISFNQTVEYILPP